VQDFVLSKILPYTTEFQASPISFLGLHLC